MAPEAPVMPTTRRLGGVLLVWLVGIIFFLFRLECFDYITGVSQM